MAKDTSYLIKRGNTYLVNVKVPAHLRESIGRAHLRETTGTDSLARANALKHGIIHRLKTQVAQAEETHRGAVGSRERSRIGEAMQWREDIAQAEEIDRHGPADEGQGQWDLMTGLLADRAEEIEEREGLTRAKEFHAIATGSATPITALVDQWITERPMKPRQQIDYRRAVAKLIAWLSTGRHAEAIEKVTRRIAGTYVSEAFVKAGVHPRTANKDISAIASLWKWAKKKGHVDENIWEGQSLAKPKPTKAEDKRAFTDEEIDTLFAGSGKVKPSPLLRDFMAIAALSAMRIEEIARLTVADIRSGCFDITKSKTPAGVRMVPIHSALSEIVTRRTEGKKPSEALFPELPEPKPGSAIERSQKASKAFTAYRRKVGVDDMRPGARQSRTDFHSWRRTFATKAEQAGNVPHWISVVMGHERAGMTLGLYSEGPLMEQRRAVVESVHIRPLASGAEGEPKGAV